MRSVGPGTQGVREEAVLLVAVLFFLLATQGIASCEANAVSCSFTVGMIFISFKMM